MKCSILIYKENRWRATAHTHIRSVTENALNRFDCAPISAEEIALPVASYPHEGIQIPVIEALDGQLITNALYVDGKQEAGCWVSDVERDILKMVVVNRYHKAPVAVCFTRNFGFKTGAIASSVAHDSHNIIAVGADDDSLVAAVNALIATKGGIGCAHADRVEVLPLPVAGLMSADDGYSVAQRYTALSEAAKALGQPVAGTVYDAEFYGAARDSSPEAE